jgi:hypothetical protein
MPIAPNSLDAPILMIVILTVICVVILYAMGIWLLVHRLRGTDPELPRLLLLRRSSDEEQGQLYDFGDLISMMLARHRGRRERQFQAQLRAAGRRVGEFGPNETTPLLSDQRR